MKQKENSKKFAKVFFGKKCFNVEVASSNLERKSGLMGREKLGIDDGMLFVFEISGKYNFWMKSTRISLDIIWISSDSKVVFIKNNAQPSSGEICERIAPNITAKYVLEINSGLADKFDIKKGDKMIIKF